MNGGANNPNKKGDFMDDITVPVLAHEDDTTGAGNMLGEALGEIYAAHLRRLRKMNR